VLAGEGTERLAQSVYPAYYLLLSAVVAGLSFAGLRGWLRRVFKSAAETPQC
jgi:hypothetical protein